MEVLLLAIYAFFVWLIFFKFKWLRLDDDGGGDRRHDPDHRAWRG